MGNFLFCPTDMIENTAENSPLVTRTMEQQRPQPPDAPSNSSSSSPSQFQGVLWKRRDVFKNRWRPRWFVLQPLEGLMTYYVDDGASNDDSSLVQYDVVPRGTIYLRSCRVEIDHVLSRPLENLYAFVITPPPASNMTPCFLAATSEQERTEWMEKLKRICTIEEEEESDSVVTPSVRSAADEDEGAEIESWGDVEDGKKEALTNLPEQLASRIQSTLETNLPFVSGYKKEHGWKVLSENRHGVTAHERRLDSHGNIMLKSTAMINHPPKQILSLLVDNVRRQDFETNIHHGERLKRYSDHTFLDYYSYRPVWPTSARDLVAVVHWRVLEKKIAATAETTTFGDDNDSTPKAICILGFSWSDAESQQLKPLVPENVRANLLVSLYLLEEIKQGSNRPKCRVTRVLSYDLGGNLPRSLANTVLHQQATMPSVIDQHLSQTEPTVEDRLLGALLHKDIVKNVIEPMTRADPNERRQSFVDRSKIDQSRIVDKDATAMQQETTEPSTLFVAIWLLAPIVLWKLAPLLRIPAKEILFLTSAWFAARTVVLAHAGRPFPTSISCAMIGHVTCRFSVDLKGVLRFIAHNKKEQEEETQPPPNDKAHEVSVVPIVVKALAQAMSQGEALSCKRVYQPLLGIDGLFLPSSKGRVDVSVLSAKHSSEDGATACSDSLVTIRNATAKSIQEIANSLAGEQMQQQMSTKSSWRSDSLGSCLVVLATPDSHDPCEVDLDVALSPSYREAVNVVLVVGGVHLTREPNSSNGRSPRASLSKKPVLSISMTIHGPVCNVATSREFADKVQKFLHFPEMCDE